MTALGVANVAAGFVGVIAGAVTTGKLLQLALSNGPEVTLEAHGYPTAQNGRVWGVANQDCNLDFRIGTAGYAAAAVAVRFNSLGRVGMFNLPAFASDALAGTGGLATGYLYHDGAGALRIKL